MDDHFADRLLAAIEAKGSPVCVGLDPDCGRLPEPLRSRPPVEAIDEFCAVVIRAVAPHVPAVKPQIAHFERYGAAGVAAYRRAVAAARSAGLIVIGDVKRGDIGSTAAQYAAWHLADEGPDAITVNGYFGADGWAPFVEVARRAGKGLFVLVRTSNPSAATIQDFADAAGKRFYEHIAEQVAAAGSGADLVGRRGFSCLGAVVGATYPEEARRLRRIMPRALFLVPGYGAQGASGEDCAAAFTPEGTGAIVNASRSVIYAFDREESSGAAWPGAVASAAEAFAADVRQAVAKAT